MENNKSFPINRRSFLTKTVFSCSLCCIAASNLPASNTGWLAQSENHKFDTDSAMSMQEVFNFTFTRWYIPPMKNLMKEIGQKKFLEMLKRSSILLQKVEPEKNIDYSDRTLKLWSENIINACKTMDNRLSYEIVRNDNERFEVNFTECLWAKTFREADAAEIGFAGVCYQDYEMAKAFNPKLTLTRTKTLMQGDNHCNFKWTMDK